MEKTTIRELGIITIVFLAASLVLYGYFGLFTKGGMDTVYRNWDGPAYVVVAKSLYNPAVIGKVNKLQPLITRPSYFSQQFPLYPLFIRLFSFLGYYQSMIVVSQVFSLLFLYACYFLLRDINQKANALLVGILLVFYTPRWFIVSHVGSSEPVFLFFLTMLWLLYRRKKMFLSALCGALAVLAKPTGIFVFLGIVLYSVLFRPKVKTIMPYLLIPLALSGLFGVYKGVFGNFFIYLDETGRYPFFQLPPFTNFTTLDNYYNVWKEGLLFLYLLYGVGLAVLIERKLYFLAVTMAPYYLYLLFVHHPDISRYMLPILPLLAVAFEPVLSKKSVYIPLFLFVPVIYLFAVSYMQYNIAGAL